MDPIEFLAKYSGVLKARCAFEEFERHIFAFLVTAIRDLCLEKSIVHGSKAVC